MREDVGQASPPVQWLHTQGAEVSGLGAPVAVLALQAPVKRAAHLRDWEMLRDSTG
ncbi:hypothetical protein [Yinghuangia soli]|uniref:Uncharacterized protein n=1 Tax=Yinghuangia soli TaxID=2908204 RepID=A0AA41U117_9ACTN|nr:hypothetical protein [Yinghuangia soli]MCF2530353.1 hypothetical protein [Yinghuangia soli]